MGLGEELRERGIILAEEAPKRRAQQLPASRSPVLWGFSFPGIESKLRKNGFDLEGCRNIFSR